LRFLLKNERHYDLWIQFWFQRKLRVYYKKNMMLKKWLFVIEWDFEIKCFKWFVFLSQIR
jgi:hypothetical protein